MLFAQALWMGGWSVGSLAVAIVVTAGVCAVVFVVLRKLNISIPDWVVNIFWIVVVVAVGIMAIRLLMSL